MNKRWDGLALASIGGAASVSLLCYGDLPARVATHFDAHGNADGWMSKPAAAVFIPALGLGVWALLRFAPRVLPASEKRRLSGGVVPLLAAVVTIFMAAVHVVLMRLAVAPGASPVPVVHVLVGLLFMVVGLVLPRVRKNALIGVRTPWTLTSDENWARTHRVAGYAFMASGAAAVLASLIGGAAAGMVAVALLLLGGLVPAIYSLVLARRMDPS